MAVLVPAVLATSALLWAAGLLLFVKAGMTTRWKATWLAILVSIGVGVGFVLPMHGVWTRFLWVMAALPLVAAADVVILRSDRGVRYWIRACGFETVTVFAAAAAARFAFDHLGVAALVWRRIDWSGWFV